jgi:hypothetical protein
MKLRTYAVLAALLALPPLTTAQDQRYYQKQATLAYQWDLDGEAADDDQVVTAANGALTDSKTFTKTADPDTPRLVDITVTDADSSITAGVLTLVGTDSLGYAKTCTHTFTGAGSGVKTLVCTDGTGAYFATISSITTGVLTGEGAGDVVIVGYTSNSPNTWALYGVPRPTGAGGEHGVDPFAATGAAGLITTNGDSTTTITSASGSPGAFTPVVAGDLLIIQPPGSSSIYRLKVTAKASNDSITVHDRINIPSSAWSYRYQHFYASPNPADVMAIPVHGYTSATFTWWVAANADTAGVITKLECTSDAPTYPSARWVTQPLPITTIASGATTVDASGAFSAISESIDLEKTGYTYCRQGFRFGTGDDADAGAVESIGYAVALVGPGGRVE